MTTRKPKVSPETIAVLELMLRAKKAQAGVTGVTSRERLAVMIAEDQVKALSEALGALRGSGV